MDASSYASACSWELMEGVRVAGNINTLACMKVRSGRLAITFMASSLRCSSLFGFLVDVLVFSTVDMSFANASVTLRLEVEVSSLAVVNSYNSGSTPSKGLVRPLLLQSNWTGGRDSWNGSDVHVFISGVITVV